MAFGVIVQQSKRTSIGLFCEMSIHSNNSGVSWKEGWSENPFNSNANADANANAHCVIVFPRKCRFVRSHIVEIEIEAHVFACSAEFLSKNSCWSPSECPTRPLVCFLVPPMPSGHSASDSPHVSEVH